MTINSSSISQEIMKPGRKKVLGRPTGQGFGTARKGPSVQGPIEAVSDESYKKGESFKVDSVKTIGNYGQTGN